MISSNLQEKVHKLPLTPGVYIYTNVAGEVIYVGKAKNLKNRVSSYFRNNLDPHSKTYALVQQIDNLDYINVGSEIEALILEAKLIKQYLPHFNVLLKDDKSYLYIVIRPETVMIGDEEVIIDKIITARKTTLLREDTYFGPYPDGRIVKNLLKTLRKIFPFRDCSFGKYSRYHKLKNPCLYGHLGLCPAPCQYQEDAVKTNQANIKKIRKILSGGYSKILEDIKRDMDFASKAQKYEEAVSYRDLLSKFDYVRQSFKSPEEYLENPYLQNDISYQALSSLKEVIPSLTTIPTRIECYDISNISGKEAVGSMVVATNGSIDKSEYKRFRIKLKNTPDDFGMMSEVLSRRLKHEISISSKPWGLPDLIVLDGGKGQLSAVLKVMDTLNLHIPLIGLAKKFETIVYREDDHFVEVQLEKSYPGLKLLIQLRDEAHRFAQKYHHFLRLKSIRI